MTKHALAVAVLLAASFAFAQDAVPPSDAAVFAQLKSFEHGQSMAPLHTVERMLEKTSDPAGRAALAQKLAALLADAQTTLDAKGFICKQLPLVATDAGVDAMAKLLTQAGTVEMAREALEHTPLAAALAALREDLPRRKGGELVAVIHSLGNRRDAQSAGALAGLLKDADPAVASAAALALGRIASPAACEALAKAHGDAKGPLLEAIREGQLDAAEALAAEDPAAAGALYEALWNDSDAKRFRLPALRGLLATRKEQAAAQLVQALDGPDASFYPIARSLAAEIPGTEITKLLVIELGKLQGAEKAALIDALAARQDPAARQSVLDLLNSDDLAVQYAAARAMATLGDAACVEPLLSLAGDAKGSAAPAARLALARIRDKQADAALLKAAATGAPDRRVAAIRALADRRTENASAVLLQAAGDGEPSVRLAALGALAVVAPADSYDKLIPLAASANEEQAEPARKALLAVAARLPDEPARVRPVLAALDKAAPAQRVNLLRVLGLLGTADALPAVRAALKDADAAVVDAAVRALADWPDPSAADALLDLASNAANPPHRVLAMRGYLRMAATAKIAPAERTALFERARNVARTPEAKRMLLAGLMDAPDAGALKLAVAYLNDADVQAEAIQSVLALGRLLASTARADVQEAMVRIESVSKDKKVLNEARAVAASTRKPLSANELAKFLTHDAARSAATKKMLNDKAPAGYAVTCYLDCGADGSDGQAPSVKLVSGAPYFWAGADTVAPVRFGSIWFDARKVAFEAAGLKADRNYQVGLSWWDFDHDDRTQSLWAVAKGKEAMLIKPTRLPSYQVGQHMPQELVVPLPRELTAGGSVRLEFRIEGKTNVVVSELWLLESTGTTGVPPVARETGQTPVPPKTGETPVLPYPAAPKDAPKAWEGPVLQPLAAAPAPAGAVKVLIVTGDDLHNWKATSPVLAELLAKDKRLHVSIAYDARFLADPKLHDYDVVVLHYVKWHKPDLAEPCRENLKKFVTGGKGLVVVHFACGAFQKWAGFEALVGRVYNPKLRGHDPHGTFTVRITDDKHPITSGMKDFQTLDELYTCLDGKTPIQVLAMATSKVDKKDYPMAFVLTAGKGKVFHCPLGHDVRAFAAEGVQELFRRGTAWVAGK